MNKTIEKIETYKAKEIAKALEIYLLRKQVLLCLNYQKKT